MDQGGAILVHNAYQTTISGSVFSGNYAGSGGAFGGTATGLVVENSLFISNRAVDTTQGRIVRGYGGAIALDGVSNDYNPDSSNRLRVCGSTFQDNIAIRGGGAIDAVISDNLGTMAICTRSKFTGNRADGVAGEMGQGGTLWLCILGHGKIVNTTPEGNSTSAPYNTVGQGGAAAINLGIFEVTNTVFANNHKVLHYPGKLPAMESKLRLN